MKNVFKRFLDGLTKVLIVVGIVIGFMALLFALMWCYEKYATATLIVALMAVIYALGESQ